MKKIFSLLFVLLFANNINLFAESDTNTLQMQIDSLTNRLNEMEQKVAYNELMCDLKQFNTELSIDRAGINTKALNLIVNTYNNDIDIDVYEAYKENIESIKKNYESKKDLYNTLSSKTFLYKMIYKFSESEISLLDSQRKVIALSFKSFDAGMAYYESALNMYKS